MENKNKELVINTLKLLKHSEFETKLELELLELKKQSSSKIQNKFNLIINELRVNHNLFIWEEFEKVFLEINSSFYNNLVNNFTELTSNEKKLGALIKLKMSTKDIASLLNISVRSVETARYRLRKKMKLNKEDNLDEILQKI